MGASSSHALTLGLEGCSFLFIDPLALVHASANRLHVLLDPIFMPYCQIQILLSCNQVIFLIIFQPQSPCRHSRHLEVELVLPVPIVARVIAMLSTILLVRLEGRKEGMLSWDIGDSAQKQMSVAHNLYLANVHARIGVVVPCLSLENLEHSPTPPYAGQCLSFAFSMNLSQAHLIGLILIARVLAIFLAILLRSMLDLSASLGCSLMFNQCLLDTCRRGIFSCPPCRVDFYAGYHRLFFHEP